VIFPLGKSLLFGLIFQKGVFHGRISTIFLFLLSTVRAENVFVRTTMGCVITHDGFPFSAGKRFVLNANAQDYAVFENVVIPKPVCAFWREVNDLPFRPYGL